MKLKSLLITTAQVNRAILPDLCNVSLRNSRRISVLPVKVNGYRLRSSFFARTFATAAICLYLSDTSVAQEGFPDRPITVVVPAQPGGSSDVLFRKLALAAQAITGNIFIVMNKPGASATMGTTFVTHAKPDGYTLGGVWNGPLTMAPLMVPVPYKPTSYDPVIQISSAPIVFCVRKDFPATNGKEFVAQLRANPDKYTYGTTDGYGGSIHFGVTRVFKSLDVSARLIPFNSTPANLQGFLSGSVDIYTGSSALAVKGSMDSGAAKCLLVSSAEDNAAVPQASGMSAMGVPDAASYIWYGIIAPADTPVAIVAKLESIFQEAAATPSVKEYLQSVGMEATLRKAPAMRKIIDGEYAKNLLISKDLKMIQQ
ncbi:MAG: tripartite tricarboxylate transporter substrate binding protein [Alcaligenaceae bacterium]